MRRYLHTRGYFNPLVPRAWRGSPFVRGACAGMAWGILAGYPVDALLLAILGQRMLAVVWLGQLGAAIVFVALWIEWAYRRGR